MSIEEVKHGTWCGRKIAEMTKDELIEIIWKQNLLNEKLRKDRERAWAMYGMTKKVDRDEKYNRRYG